MKIFRFLLLSWACFYIHNLTHANHSGLKHHGKVIETKTKDDVDLSTKFGLSIDSSTVKVAMNPVDSAKQTWRDVEVVGNMGKNVATTLSKAKEFEIKATLNQLKSDIKNPTDPTFADINNTKLVDFLENATDGTAKEFEQKVEDFINIKSRIYNGQDPNLEGHKLSNDAAAFNEKTNEVYININGTDLPKPKDIYQSMRHEKQREDNATNSWLSGLTPEQQTAIAKHRGEQDARTYESIHGNNNHKPKKSADDFFVNNRAHISENNRYLSTVDEGVVRERFAEHFIPSYKKAIKEGDYEKAAKIKQRCDMGENVFAALLAGKAGVAALAAYDLAESAIDISKDIKDKNYKSALNTVGTIGLESALSYGAGKALGNLATTVSKMPAVQNMMNKAKNIFSKETVQAEVKVVEQVVEQDLKQFTKSNLKLGQEMHKKYKFDQTDNLVRRKELKLPSGRRPDFIDLEKGIIYELKPNNPRAIKAGQKQLEMYLKELQSLDKSHDLFRDKWTGILETY